MLEEAGVPYRVALTDIRKGDQKSDDYRRLNPMGKVPALTDGAVVVTECPAICMYLADCYAPGRLAPATDDPRRGAYLRWMVFSTAVLEPSLYLDEPEDAALAKGRGWGERAAVMASVEQALTPGPWLLGEMFSAADVMLGAVVSVALFNKRVADPPAFLTEYDARLSTRPAYKRAAEATWGVA